MSKSKLTKFMIILKPAGSTTKMNVASRMAATSLRRELLQNDLIINLAVIKSQTFKHGEIHN